MKTTRREMLKASAALLLPNLTPAVPALPKPHSSYASWDEVAELLVQIEGGAVRQLLENRYHGHWPGWLHYVAAIKWNDEVVVFYGVGAPEHTAVNIGQVAGLCHSGGVPILGEYSTLDDRLWAVAVHCRVSDALVREVSQDREEKGMKPFKMDADWWTDWEWQMGLKAEPHRKRR